MKLERNCPKCHKLIIYKSESGYKSAIKNGSICRKCAASGENNGMFGKVGKLNPFFNKTHNPTSIKKMQDARFGKKHSIESLEKMKGISAGEKNPMFGKTVYGVWLDKYGKEIADNKMADYKRKHSENSKGPKNNMFGKPSPMGAGNGWSGWYRGWFFRSIRELTYMIKIIERFNLKWVSGENKKFKIKYVDYKGNDRNYFPDFIINNKYIIESKPKKLWFSDNVIRKKEAATNFAKINNLKYKIVDIGVLSDVEIKSLYETGQIKFIDRYERLYQKKFNGKIKHD